MIFTSYYANKRIKEYNCYSISNGYVTGIKFPLATPSWELVNEYKAGAISDSEYKNIYLELLEIRKEDILREVKLCKSPTVFLCYEKPPKFCHRHIFAEWLNNNGYIVKELEY